MDWTKMKSHNILQPVLILIFILLVSGPGHGFDLKKKVLKEKLSNGITVLLLERHLSPTVSLYIRYRVGAVDEEKRRKRRGSSFWNI